MAGKLLLGLAVLADLALAVLLIGLSGFLFERSPLDGLWLETVYMAAVIACVVAPATAFILNAAGKRRPAQAVAWLPVAVALLVLAIPAL
jgi:hypothetical protein